MNSKNQTSAMNQKIFKLGLPVETVSVYLMCCSLTDTDTTISTKKLTEMWNSTRASLLEGLRDYTIGHFSYEEDLMRKHHYPNYSEHRKSHDSFLEKIDDLENRLHENEMIPPIEIIHYLQSWLSNHFFNLDGDYADYFKKHRIELDPDYIF